MNTSYTILYVDDDQDDLMLIADAFEQYASHLSVVQAHNGLEGLTTLKKMQEKRHLPCLVVLDINMPLMDGKEMLKKLRSNSDFQDLPVILFSTSNNPKEKLFAQDHNAEFITKPVDFSNLQLLVSAFVSKCKLEAANSA